MLHKPLAVAALLAASCGAQAASDADLAAIRSQIDEMKKSYEQRIAALEQRLAQAEADVKAKPVPQTGARPVMADNPPPAAPATSANAFNPEVSLILQGQYAQMKNVPDRTITGFWPAGGHDDHGKGVSTRGFSLNHTELIFSAGIDPYWRGQAIFAVQDEAVEVEEAWFQSLAIGHGVGLRGGRYRSGIGYLNEQHPHQWDFANAPLMYNALFGQEASYREDGLQLKWLAPPRVSGGSGADSGRGPNSPATAGTKTGPRAWAAYVHVGDDLGVANSWRTGLSYLKTSSGDREADFVDINGLQAQGLFNGDTSTWLADFVWKWAPDGNPKYQNFKFQSEYFVRKDKGDLTCMDENGVGNACATPVTSDYDTRQSGWYAQGVYQFTPEWRAGLRYDQLDSGRQNLGANSANLTVEDYKPKRATAMVDYSWSEFSRVRLQYAQDNSMAGITDNQWIVQYIMSLGAHGVHKF